MNICYVMESFTLGGVEKVTFQLLNTLGRRAHETNHKYYLKVIDDDGALKGLFDHLENVEVSSIGSHLAFRNFCITQDIDCVVFTKGGISRYGVLLPRNIKTFAIQHVPINLPQVSKIKNALRMLGAAVLYRRVNAVVCVSEGIRQNLISHLRLKASSVETIYNAVIDPNVDTLAAQPVEYDDYWVFVGRLSYQKGTDMLAEVVRLCAKQEAGFKLVIIGDGPDKEQFIDTLAKLGISDNVILHGFSDNPYKYIKHAKGLILPSRWEGLPTVLVEAAYLGTQTVSFDCRYGPSELTKQGQYGYLIEQDDVTAFADAILKVEKKITKPLPNVVDFTADQAAKNYEKFTNSLSVK